MRISDWSSDVCSSDLQFTFGRRGEQDVGAGASPCFGLCAQRARQRQTTGIVAGEQTRTGHRGKRHAGDQLRVVDRKSVVEGKSVSVRVDLGGRRLIKKTTRV